MSVSIKNIFQCIVIIKITLESTCITNSKILIKCDNTSAINLSKNLVQHSKSKHIEIRHHFIREHVVNEDVILNYINIEYQIADIFTKPLREDRFCSLRRELRMININA